MSFYDSLDSELTGSDIFAHLDDPWSHDDESGVEVFNNPDFIGDGGEPLFLDDDGHLFSRRELSNGDTVADYSDLSNEPYGRIQMALTGMLLSGEGGYFQGTIVGLFDSLDSELTGSDIFAHLDAGAVDDYAIGHAMNKAIDDGNFEEFDDAGFFDSPRDAWDNSL